MKNLTKRAFDLLACFILITIALPLSIAAAVAIMLESRGSPLFIQQRVGRGGRPFRLYKLRTMKRSTGDLPSHEVAKAQITRVGAFLRRTKLDELPQLINVLNGTMSLVGPRPCLLSQSELIAHRHNLGLYAFPPGITGPGQVQGIDMSNPALLTRIEAEYFHNASIRGDLSILLKTISGAGRGDAALTDGSGSMPLSSLGRPC
jgi:O-antigen biosynthesis protein WbqP